MYGVTENYLILCKLDVETSGGTIILTISAAPDICYDTQVLRKPSCLDLLKIRFSHI